MGIQDAQAQIEEFKTIDLPELLEKLPANGHHEDRFERIGDLWTYTFTYASPCAHFAATGTGPTPRQAFVIARNVIMDQVNDWHKMREGDVEFYPRGEREGKVRQPSVIIVDDDVDMALATEKIFQGLGCKTLVVSDPADVHRKISFQEADFIVLDWKLDANTLGSDVMKRANKLIAAFSDLKQRFGLHQPKVITHSVLSGSEIEMPETSYFTHFDHWQKPLRFDQLVQRGGAILDRCGF